MNPNASPNLFPKRGYVPTRFGTFEVERLDEHTLKNVPNRRYYLLRNMWAFGRPITENKYSIVVCCKPGTVRQLADLPQGEVVTALDFVTP